MIIPPGYGHISINPSPDKTLAMANIVSTAFKSEYGEYESRHGAAYFELHLCGTPEETPVPALPPVRTLRPKSGNGDHRIAKARSTTSSETRMHSPS